MTCRPALDLRAKPKHGAPAPEVEHRPGHVLVPNLILADAVSICQAEDLSDVLSIDEVVNQYSTGALVEGTALRGRVAYARNDSVRQEA